MLAQCPAGQMDLTVEIETDNYGFEGYWQLVPEGNSCGVGTLWAGGNILEVGCSGAGEKDATSGNGYANDVTVVESVGCIDYGFYDLIYVDDWGDGGFSFHVELDGYDMYHFVGADMGNTFAFEVTPPLNYDASVTSISTKVYNYVGDITIEGLAFNFGADTINSLEVIYSVDGGADVVSTLTGLNMAPFSSAAFAHPIPWNAVANGIYSIKLSTGKVNDNDDLNVLNDFTIKDLHIGDPIPNVISEYLTFVEGFEVIGDASDDIDLPTDLDFHPVLSDYQVWIVNKGTEALGGSTVTFYNAGTPAQTSEWKQDGNAWHFMSLPTGIAFSENTNFATSPGIKDANHAGGTFTGPTLWSSDMDIYAEPSGGNGSHLDMLHQSPFSMGIAAWRDNAFFVFCDFHGFVHMYDFQADHGPGNHDHSDGRVWEYYDFDIGMISKDLPSHLVFDKASNYLYTVDAAKGRIIRMNPESGEVTGTFPHPNEPLAEANIIENTDWVEIVSSGLIEPVGIDVIDNFMLVSDHATGEIIIYDITSVPAVELNRIQTERTGLMGIKIGPDGLIWFVDQDLDELVRITLTDVVAINETSLENSINVYPNPSNGVFVLSCDNSLQHSVLEISILNQLGQIVYANKIDGPALEQFDISMLAAGTYTLNLTTVDNTISKQLIILK